MILGYLHRYGSIDRYRALSHFEVWDLPAQIGKIRKMDIDITRKGHGKNLKYSIQEVADKYKVNQPTQLPIISEEEAQYVSKESNTQNLESFSSGHIPHLTGLK